MVKSFFVGLFKGLAGCVLVLAFAAGVCYFGGFFDFVNPGEEASAVAVPLVDFVSPAVQREEASAPAPSKEKEPPKEQPAKGNTEEEPKEEISLVFAGDLYLTSQLQEKYRREGVSAAASEDLLGFLRDADLFILNEEFPFGTTGEPMEEKEYTFRVPPDMARILPDLGVDVVTLANNHILDFGREPLAETLRALDETGIAHVGAGENLEEAKACKTFELGGKTVGILGASRVIPVYDWNAASDRSGVFTTYDPTLLIGEIEKAKEYCDFVAVFVHWGIEHTTEIEEYQRSLGRQYIDAGADVVIGSHPHVLQGIEYYKGRPICYSLGNFIFNNSVYDTMLAEVRLSGDKAGLRIVPCVSAGNQVRLSGEADTAYQSLEAISFGIVIGEDGVVRELPQ